ncbi:hypothetical protein CLAFUW4_08327 [Fulvia fulva]|uniref:Uncharacterized protein n=1 Tax=Passalora fulva TaxID=5499 RepID=A0A9Q8LCA7_PASFU|nr:uncharacterized protein CLAFUR5_08435 [Fulvia fulva]KAK4629606.1 hypothetical protein CLAFUR4_08332 [Fulvia fulva]UJO14756.1 hypothetical protein CLAFUR5_08435 [Fulvia fulva]WPV12075.1 hypothetical protein CLAFUW4_08327 [Fulvia fulva]WPV27321.1 hypothetical protein CLAFUW7_08327 [Fulvia fulva]
MLRLSKFAQMAANAKNALTSRDAASTQQNLETINTQVEKLAATLKAYAGGLLAASGISSDQAKLSIDMRHTIADANAAQVVTEDEAKEIIQYLNDTIEPSIRSTMTALQEKKAELEKAGLKGTVSGDMADLRKLTRELGEVLLSKSPEGTRKSGEEVMAKVDADFEEALKAFA